MRCRDEVSGCQPLYGVPPPSFVTRRQHEAQNVYTLTRREPLRANGASALVAAANESAKAAEDPQMSNYPNSTFHPRATLYGGTFGSEAVAFFGRVRLLARALPSSREVNIRLILKLVLKTCFLGILLVGPELPAADLSRTVRFVAWMYNMAGQEEYYRELAQAFEKKNPGSQVQIELQPWNEAHNRLQRWTTGEPGPDLVIIPDVWLAEFAPALEPYAAKLPSNLMTQFDNIMLERARYRGEILGLVWGASTKALFYRTDLFREAGLSPPSNWDDLLAAAKKLTRAPQVYGLALPGAPELDTADNFYFFLWSNGGDIFDRRGNVKLGRPEALEALTFYRDLVRKFQVTEPDVLGCNRSCAEAWFAQGKAAMVETGPWAIRAFRSAPVPVPFAVVPLPQRKEQITQLVTDHLILLRNSTRKDAALKFIEFAYQPSWRLGWARLGVVPERKDVAANNYFREDPSWRVFTSVLDRTRWIPLMHWEPIDRTIRMSLAEVLAGRVEPQKALTDLAERLAVLAAR